MPNRSAFVNEWVRMTTMRFAPPPPGLDPQSGKEEAHAPLAKIGLELSRVHRCTYAVATEELILDPQWADQWFAQEDEQTEARAMATTLRTEIAARIAGLRQADDPLVPGKIVRELHSLRGAIASIGFSACACHLLALEKNWAEMTEADRSRELRAALETFNAGLAQLTTRYPYLNGA